MRLFDSICMWSQPWTSLGAAVQTTGITDSCHSPGFTTNPGVIPNLTGMVHLTIHSVIHSCEFYLKDSTHKACGNLWIGVESVEIE